MSEYNFSRRHFFFGSLLAGAVPTGGFGSTPSLTAVGYKSLMDKLNIALIGLGLRGPQIVEGAAASENIVALCDVDDKRGANTVAAYPKATRYKDFRKMLEKEGKNIDAVMVAIPDHSHAPVSLYAMQHGKHVYCEKPLTPTIWEAKLLADAAVKYKVATQMGNQGYSHEGTRTASEIVWSGDIGDVREVYGWTGGSSGGQVNIPAGGLPGTPIPDTFDWDMWLGPASMRPYNNIIPGHWRAFIDFSLGGSLGDWLVHCFGPANMALQLGTVSPTSVECVAVEGKNQWLWPAKLHTVFEFPARGNMPPVKVHACQGTRGGFVNPPGMAENATLLPQMNNLGPDKNRPSSTDDAGTTLAGGDQLMPDGKPNTASTRTRFARQFGAAPGGPGGPGGAAGRGPGGPGGPGGAAGRGAGGPGGPGGPGGAGGRGNQAADPDRSPGNGSIFIGSKGYMATSGRGEGVWLLPESRWAEYKLPPQLLPRGVNHQQDWIRACKGGTSAVSDFAVATRFVEWLGLAAIAWRVPGKLLWDGQKKRFTNSEEANKYLAPNMRKGWEMKL
jgi:hypothetical protein